jgi:hypothetical protein
MLCQAQQIKLEQGDDMRKHLRSIGIFLAGFTLCAALALAGVAFSNSTAGKVAAQTNTGRWDYRVVKRCDTGGTTVEGQINATLSQYGAQGFDIYSVDHITQTDGFGATCLSIVLRRPIP